MTVFPVVSGSVQGWGWVLYVSESRTDYHCRSKRRFSTKEEATADLQQYLASHPELKVSQ